MVARTSAEDVRVHSYCRGEVLRSLFLKLASWFESSNERARRREIEAFLSQATNIADLEARILQLQRNEGFLPFADVRDASQSEAGAPSV